MDEWKLPMLLELENASQLEVGLERLSYTLSENPLANNEAKLSIDLSSLFSWRMVWPRSENEAEWMNASEQKMEMKNGMKELLSKSVSLM